MPAGHAAVEQPDPDPAQQTVSVVTRVVKKGREGDYQAWLDRVLAAASEEPGYLGVIEFEQTGGLFHVAQRFRSPGDLDRWEARDRYCALMREADDFSTPRRQRAGGERPCVCLPSDGDSAKWKRFVSTWLAVLPLVVLLNTALNALPVRLPGPAQAAVSSLVMVASMTWVILPAVSRRLKPWVLRDGDGDARAGGGAASA